MKLIIDKHQHRLLSRVLRWTLEEAQKASTYGVEAVMHPFVVDELESLLLRIDPTAKPLSIVQVPQKSDQA